MTIRGGAAISRPASFPCSAIASPLSWREQGPLRLQIEGLATGHDHTVVRGNIEAGEFSVFCYRGDHLLGIESINRPADPAHARRILAAGRQVTRAQLGRA